MPAIGLAEAARLTGRNRSTIHRAMQTGRLSYTKTEDGERRIEVAELERVFGITLLNGAATMQRSNGAQPAKSHSTHRLAQRGEVAALRELIDTLQATVARQDATIRSIQDEKRTLLALLTGPNRVPWWRRWFR